MSINNLLTGTSIYVENSHGNIILLQVNGPVYKTTNDLYCNELRNGTCTLL